MGGGREKDERDDRREEVMDEGVSDREGGCCGSKEVGLKTKLRGLAGTTSLRDEQEARWAWVW